MCLLAHHSGGSIPVWWVCTLGGFGLLLLLLPGVILAWSHFWAELGGTQPIEGHFLWSKAWIRLCGLFAIGVAGCLLYSRTLSSLPKPSPQPEFPVSAPSEEQDVLEYERLVDAERWDEALPIIEEIVQRSPNIPTSWFNWGVCLSTLGRESEAAEKFLKAYELAPDDYGAQYRAFRSLFFAQDYAAFLEFATQECDAHPEMIEHLLADDDFSTLFARPEFQELRDRYQK